MPSRHCLVRGDSAIDLALRLPSCLRKLDAEGFRSVRRGIRRHQVPERVEGEVGR